MEYIIEVFSGITRFIRNQFHSVYHPDERALVEIFYSDGLTLLGTMAVIMAGVSLVLLVFNLIRSFLSR